MFTYNENLKKFYRQVLIVSYLLMWMFCKKIFYSKIKKIHHRTLKVIYGIDDFYNKSQINPEFMWLFFKQKKLSYSLRKEPILNLLRTQSTYGTNAVHFRGSL